MEVNKKHSFFDTFVYGSILILSTFVVFFSTPASLPAQASQSGCQADNCLFTTSILHRATKMEIDNQGQYSTFITRQELLNDGLKEAGLDMSSGIVSNPHRYTELNGGDIKVSIAVAIIPVKIIDQNRAYTVTTSYSTVKNILYACNIELNSKDKVYPALDTLVTAGSNIVIDRAVSVEIAYGEKTFNLATQADNVSEVMAEAKEELDLPAELTNHNLDHDVYAGQKISLVKIDESETTEFETIKPETQYQNDWDMTVGEEQVISLGVAGEIMKKYHLTLENGVEISRELISEEITRPSEPTIIAVGQKQPAVTAPADNYAASGGQVGTASWYYHGDAPAAAHRDFPRGTNLLVTNNSTGASVVVVVNDYGPALWTGRVIDLNSVAFAAIAPLGQGLVEVTVTPL
ncbi:MAG: G5 domain-containing protein [Patescibacteria group bacterium]